MENKKTIFIHADASQNDSPRNEKTMGPVRFRRGDTITIDVLLTLDGKPIDTGGFRNATLEILDVGAINSPSPRTVNLLLWKRLESIEEPQRAEDGSLNVDSRHLRFILSKEETLLDSGEKWIRLYADFEGAQRVTFAGGWIYVDDNFGCEPSLLPMESPEFIGRSEMEELYCSRREVMEILENFSANDENLKALETSCAQHAANALASQNAASASERNAKSSEKNAKTSEQNASASAISANTSMQSSSANATNAETAAKNAIQYARKASEYSVEAETSAQAAADSASAAEYYASLSHAAVGKYIFDTGRIVSQTTSPCQSLPMCFCFSGVLKYVNNTRLFLIGDSTNGIQVFLGSVDRMIVRVYSKSTYTTVEIPLTEYFGSEHSYCINICNSLDGEGRLKIEIYIDGELASPVSYSGTIDTSLSISNSTILSIGSSNYNYISMMQGTLKRIKVFNRLLQCVSTDGTYSMSDYLSGLNELPNDESCILSLSDAMSGAQVLDNSASSCHMVAYDSILATKDLREFSNYSQLSWAGNSAYQYSLGGSTRQFKGDTKIEIYAKASVEGMSFSAGINTNNAFYADVQEVGASWRIMTLKNNIASPGSHIVFKPSANYAGTLYIKIKAERLTV